MSSFRPNFICPGAQKAGTTTLYDVLQQHPQVCLTSRKEPLFFIDEEQYPRGLDYYRDTYFSHFDGEPVIGECCPCYLHIPDAPRRLHDTLGSELRLVFLLRQPAERTIDRREDVGATVATTERNDDVPPPVVLLVERPDALE